jgi:hypothetical protein
MLLMSVDLLNYCWSVFQENINPSSIRKQSDGWLRFLLELTTSQADPEVRNATWKNQSFLSLEYGGKKREKTFISLPGN